MGNCTFANKPISSTVYKEDDLEEKIILYLENKYKDLDKDFDKDKSDLIEYYENCENNKKVAMNKWLNENK